jgi:tetracycline resistance efflux pump
MEFGWLSILPPIIAIALALITKEVLVSLFIGIFSGVLIFTNFNILEAFTGTFGLIFESAGDQWNMAILIFLAFLGGLVGVVTAAGGSRAYGDWASKKVKTRKGAQLATILLGIVIFIDDYFNSLAVGTVMRPVTDRHRVSRAKLSYLLDSTAAPVCILAPVSSWAATIVSHISEANVENAFGTFIATIPYNFYAWLTLIMIIYIAVSKLEFGPMARFEAKAIATGDVNGGGNGEVNEDDFGGIKVSDKGKTIDLILPIVGLIVFTVIAMLYTGGLFSGEAKNVAEAFGNTDAATSLVYGGFLALILTLIMYLPRKLMTYKEFMGNFVQGMKSMVPAFCILILAWSLGGVCRDYLNTGEFVAGAINNTIAVGLLPGLIFVIAGLMSFATGTSWGTFGILIPIAVPIAMALSPEQLVPMLAAVLAGSVYGDHCSPISDTTILSSTGAGCNHIDHVTTQMPYATTTAVIAFISFLVVGLTRSYVLSLVVAIGLLIGALYLFSAKYKHNVEEQVKEMKA